MQIVINSNQWVLVNSIVPTPFDPEKEYFIEGNYDFRWMNSPSLPTEDMIGHLESEKPRRLRYKENDKDLYIKASNIPVTFTITEV